MANGGSFEYATLILAAWCYYSDQGVNENMDELEIIDFMRSELHHAAQDTQNDALGFLNQSAIFGDLIENKLFTKKYKELVHLIYGGKNIRKLMNELIG